MDLGWLLSRSTVITVAVLGAALAGAAPLLLARLGKRRSKLLNQTGYALTALSITLFIVAGFRGPA